MKILGIILIVLQVVAIAGGIAGGQLGFVLSNPGRIIGFFLPAIIGIVLIRKANAKKENG